MAAEFLSSSSSDFLKNTAARRRRHLRRFAYYHLDTVDFFNQRIPPDSRVLWIGLDVVERSRGLRCRQLYVIELDSSVPDTPTAAAVTRLKSLDDLRNLEPVDYVVLPFTLQLIDDIQDFLGRLQPALAEQTRLIAIQYNFLWAPAIRLAQLMRMKAPMPNLNWLNLLDIRNLLDVTEYQTISTGYRCLWPIWIPLLSRWVNRYLAPVPGFRWACQKSYVIARPLRNNLPSQLPSVTVVVPARNEAGNIAGVLDRMPVMGSRTEILFVEGHSRDDTWETIQAQMRGHSRRGAFTLAAMQQTGIGKADAVRLGFSVASGDVLMILDADLSVQPEDLPHFYDTLVRGHAEFLNGSRLVYRMESQAMQILNLFFNKAFAMLITLLIGQPVKDTLCGTKALLRRDYERIRKSLAHLAEMDPFGDFELLFGASGLNLKINDIPVRYRQRTYGQTNIRRFAHGWELLRLCWAIWPEFR